MRRVAVMVRCDRRDGKCLLTLEPTFEGGVLSFAWAVLVSIGMAAISVATELRRQEGYSSQVSRRTILSSNENDGPHTTSNFSNRDWPWAARGAARGSDVYSGLR